MAGNRWSYSPALSLRTARSGPETQGDQLAPAHRSPAKDDTIRSYGGGKNGHLKERNDKAKAAFDQPPLGGPLAILV
jgi:hypothetical protein